MMRRKRIGRCRVGTAGVLLAWSLVGVGCEPVAARGYRAVRLPVAGDVRQSSWAGTINESGDVLGAVTNPDTGRTAVVLWRDRRPVVLGDDNFPALLNERGDVALQRETSTIWRDGVTTTITTPTPTVLSDLDDRGRVLLSGQPAYIWADGDLRALEGLVAPAGAYFERLRMNARGQVIGQIRRGSSPYVPLSSFVWENGRMTSLGSLGGDPARTLAVAINDRGQVAGTSPTADGEPHAFVWEDGVMTDLGVPSSWVTALSDAGHIVGQTSDQAVAFMWHDGVTVEFTAPGEPSPGMAAIAPLDVNNRGHVVGITTTADSMSRAFQWNDGRMTDLGGSVYDINDRGQIVGSTPGADGITRAVIWIPTRMRPRDARATASPGTNAGPPG